MANDLEALWDKGKKELENAGIDVDAAVANIFGLGAIPGQLATAAGFDIRDPFGTKAAMQQQQNMLNEYRNQQERLMRDEQNRRWQNEISSSWAAYGSQRRSQVSMNGMGSTLDAMSANDLYLGGR